MSKRFTLNITIQVEEFQESVDKSISHLTINAREMKIPIAVEFFPQHTLNHTFIIISLFDYTSEKNYFSGGGCLCTNKPTIFLLLLARS